MISNRRALPICLTLVIAYMMSMAQTAPSGRAVGSVKAISGNILAVNTDNGGEVKVSVANGARVLQLEPGQHDLKAALPLQIQDVQVGDRVLARGNLSSDGKNLDAALLIVMKKASISELQQKEREDWQKNSIGGLVKEVDAAAHTITVTVGAGAASKSVLVRASKDTIVRRYAPNSIKFDDAKTSTLAEIKPGDQVRARGTKNADGTEMDAQEIVSGSFRNIAGTVQAVSSDDKTLTVMDLATKKSVTVRVTADSQMHQLPAMMAERIATRLKGAPVNAQGPPRAGSVITTPTAGASGNRWNGRAAESSEGNGNGGDLQRILSRMPAIGLADLKKGDAVMIVSTEGGEGNPVTAITLLSGVEPILTASPEQGKAAMALSAWSLDSGGAAE